MVVHCKRESILAKAAEVVEKDALASPNGPTWGEVEELVERTRPRLTMEGVDVPGDVTVWPKVAEKAAAVVSARLDLKAAITLAVAVSQCSDCDDIARSLELIADLIELYWDGPLGPEMDPEEPDNPAWRRVLPLHQLQDRVFIGQLRRMPIVTSSRLKVHASLSSFEVDDGAGGKALEAQAVLQDADLPDLQRRYSSLQSAWQAAGRIRDFLTVSLGPDLLQKELGADGKQAFAPLLSTLARMRDRIGGEVSRRGDDVAQPSGEVYGTDGDVEVALMESELEPVQSIDAERQMTGDVRSREDVARYIDKITDYYKAYEPSSPVPLLLERARQMVSMDFLEILANLAPNAINDVKVVTEGFAEKKKGE